MNRFTAVILLTLFMIMPAVGHAGERCRDVRSAIEQRDYRKLRGLLCEDRNISRCDADNDLLLEAIQKGDERMAEFLLAHGADVNVFNERLKKWPFFCLSHHQTELMKVMICTGQVLERRDENGKHILEHFIDDDYLDRDEPLAMVLVLLQAGCNPNMTSEEKQTALFFAARNGDKAIARALIDFGADVNWRDADGRTPLFHANDGDMAALLMDHGALTSIRDRFSVLPFVYFINQGQCRVLESLAQKKAQDILAQREALIPALKAMAGKEGRESETRLYDFLVQDESGPDAAMPAMAGETAKPVKTEPKYSYPLSMSELKTYEKLANAGRPKPLDLTSAFYHVSEVYYAVEGLYDPLLQRFERFSGQSCEFGRVDAHGKKARTGDSRDLYIGPGVSESLPYCHVRYTVGGRERHSNIIDIEAAPQQVILYLADGSVLTMKKTSRKDVLEASGVLSGTFRKMDRDE